MAGSDGLRERASGVDGGGMRDGIRWVSIKVVECSVVGNKVMNDWGFL